MVSGVHAPAGTKRPLQHAKTLIAMKKWKEYLPVYSTMAPVPPLTVKIPATLRMISTAN